MRSLRSVALILLAGSAFVAVAMQARDGGPTSVRMASAATRFLESLPGDAKKKASFSFDDPHRTTWYYTPQQDAMKNYTRKGIPLLELSAEQKKLMLDLLRTGTSDTGYNQAVTIMSLEGVLKELEKKPVNVRSPEWYFVSIFGTPSNTGSWGWRIEGHHFSVNFTLEKGEVKSITPFFFGANPAIVKSGAKDGLRTMPEIEDTARSLINALNPDQAKVALQAKHLPDVAEKVAKAEVGAPVGISADKLSPEQMTKLRALLKAYTDRMPTGVGNATFEMVRNVPAEKLYFAYSGSTEVGKPYTYRVHGPTFLVEFVNVQADGSGNAANHIHSVWRNLPGDFGL